MKIKMYEGRFEYEKFLDNYVLNNGKEINIIPSKGDFIFYDNTMYRVLYKIIDIDNNECDVFVIRACEEDY